MNNTTTCEECEMEARKTFVVCNVRMCESCLKKYYAERKLERPAIPDQNLPFQNIPTASQVIQSAKATNDPQLFDSLKQLTIADLQSKISEAAAVLHIASQILGAKAVQLAMNRKGELERETARIKREWYDRQAEIERHKQILNLRGSERAMYDNYGQLPKAFVDNFKASILKEVVLKGAGKEK